MGEIAEQTGYAKSTVHRWIEAARADWRAQAVQATDERLSIELAKLDLTEANAWKGWEASRLETLKEKTASTPDGKITSRETTTNSGEASYLATIIRCIETRCRILGIGSDHEADRRGRTLEGVAKIVEIIVNERSQIPKVMSFGQYEAALKPAEE